jgi:hypothetical protein
VGVEENGLLLIVKQGNFRWRPWIPVVFYSLAALLAILRVVRSPPNSGTLPGLFLGIGSIAMLFLAFAARNVSRLHILGRENTGAAVFNLVGYAELAKQLSEVAEKLHLKRSNVRWTRYYTAVIDGSYVSIYGGIWGPKLSFRMPTSSVTGTTVASAEQGKWNLRCVELQIDLPVRMVIDLCPIQGQWGLPVVLEGSKVDELAQGVVAGIAS